MLSLADFPLITFYGMLKGAVELSLPPWTIIQTPFATVGPHSPGSSCYSGAPLSRLQLPQWGPIAQTPATTVGPIVQTSGITVGPLVQAPATTLGLIVQIPSATVGLVIQTPAATVGPIVKPQHP